MQDKITPAIDALASAAFVEGGVSPENTQAARDLTELRKRELLAAIGAPCLHQIQEPSSAEQAAWHAGLDEGRAQAAPAAVAVPDERWCPDVCPITGRRFFGWIEHWKTGQQVPTYGGPFDSYTIPVKDEDGTFSCERFDHDAGEWMTEGMGWCDLGLQLVDDQAFIVQPDNPRYDEIRDFAEARAALAATPAAAAPVVLPEEIPASNTLWMFLTKGMTQSAIAGMPERDRKVLTERAQENWAAIRAEVGATAPVVQPEPDAAITEVMKLVERASVQRASTAVLIYTEQPKELADKAAVQERETVKLIESKLRALLAGVSAPAAQAVEPTDAELIALNAGECYFGESPSKYPELGHGTQYHAGAPGVLGFARAALALRSDPAAYSQKFQQRVQPWMMTCFGPEISADRIERNHRFLEEALELVQSLGCTASEAHQLVDYVFGRPVGDPMQEAGGVMVTLAALCLASGLDMHACGETELARIWTMVEAIRAKQAAKPKHSPLPMHAPQTQDALKQVRQAVRDFHYALDSRTHGGVAAGAAMNAIEMALNMYWHQGQEADRRSAIAAQAAQQGGDKQ